MKIAKKIQNVFLIFVLVLVTLAGCGSSVGNLTIPVAPAAQVVPQITLPEPQTEVLPEEPQEEEFGHEAEAYSEIAYDGIYTSKEDVALYLHVYGELPMNFITKSEAKKLGWEGGSLEPYAPNMCIGGDKFGNYEGQLPVQEGYHECDINTLGADSRGAERLVYSDSGNIYYTPDHYNTFEQIYESQEDQ